MSNVEHLIENAICCLENNEEYADFAKQNYNIIMAEESNIKLEDIWTMAVHVVYSVRQIWISDTVAYFQGEKELFGGDRMREYIESFI